MATCDCLHPSANISASNCTPRFITNLSSFVINSSHISFEGTSCEMPLFGKRKESGTESKSKLENKLYLAREDPEPVFDLSDCDLKNVPPGIFSLCKVFRKESLCLQNNRLASLSGGGNMQDLSLLQVLDLHCNCLTVLPNEIRFLKILKVLNVSYNKLTALPATLGVLLNLIMLDVSHNNLKELTPAIGDLRSLQELDVRGNKLVTALPPALCHATSLKSIRLDAAIFRYPPTEIVSRGTKSIMRSLAQDDGFDYEAAVEASTAENTHSENSSSRLDEHLQAKILELERLKDERRRDLVALAAERETQQRREFELYTDAGRNKDKLLTELSAAGLRLAGRLRAAAAGNEATRQRLAADICAAEVAADNAIARLLDAARNTEHNMALLAATELAEEQQILSAAAAQDSSLRREEILRAMGQAALAQAALDARLGEINAGKASASQALINQEASVDSQLCLALAERGSAQAALAQQLAQDEAAQRSAVAALLEAADSRAWALAQQVQAVEVQLAALTSAEVRRKQLHLEQQGTQLAEQRVALSLLLVQLFSAQAERRQQLLRTVQALEDLRQADQADFWLVAFQRLLDSRPAAHLDAEQMLDPRLARRLVAAGAFVSLPLLAPILRRSQRLTLVQEQTLLEAGLHRPALRQAVMDAIQAHLREDLGKDPDTEDPDTEGPTAAARAGGPSAPPLDKGGDGGGAGNVWEESECVICMEAQCVVVLVPCGHVCVCATCAAAILLCPLCRAEIALKVRAILP